MITRQKILLNFLSRSGGKVSRLNLVKWAFLFAREAETKHLATFYQFLPYKFGPFSFTMYHELDHLIGEGQIAAISERDLKISSDIDSFDLEPTLHQQIDLIYEKYGNVSTSKLIDLVYSRYPWFTLNSERRERREVSRPINKPAVYTAGYEGYQIDGFLNLLLESGMRQIIDVRCNPVSRRYGFHKSSMSRLCNKLEIGYSHKPEVGIPSSWRKDLNNPADYQRLFDLYESELLPSQGKAVSEISSLVAGTPTALVCQEADPALCHRSRLARKISNITGLGIIDLRV